MRRLREWILRFGGLFNKQRKDQELDEEIQSHLQLHIDDNLEQGMALEEARRVATLKLGGIEFTKEIYRDQRGLPMLETLWQDIRYGARMLRKNPGFTAVALLTLALGIGANTAIFSLIDAVILKWLPVERPDQLYFIQNVGPRNQDGGAPPYPCFERFRDHNQSFTGLAAFTWFGQGIRIADQVELVGGYRVSGNYFSLLGINAVLGRTFSSADDVVPGQGGPDGLTAVISYNYWTRRFGRDRAVIGKVVQLGDDPVTIVGVASPGFYGLIPGKDPNIWLPMMTAGAAQLAARESWWFNAVGRLKPGTSLEQARAELDALFQSYMDEIGISAESRRDALKRIDLKSASRGLNELRRQFSEPLQVLMTVVALVLLIACVNVANLLLARGTARRKEFAVRLAVGASRFRLLRQAFGESLLLVTLGGLVGLVFARWGSAFLVNFFAATSGLFVDLPLDYRVLTFTAGVALLTGLTFGVAPALQSMRIEPNSALKGGVGGGARVGSRFGKSLVAAQVALSLLLLVGAGLFLRTLYNLKAVDAGFQPDGVLTMDVNPTGGVYKGDRLANLWQEVLVRVGRLPGARSTSLATLTPLDGVTRIVAINVGGFTPNSDRDKGIRMNQVSPGYFQTFGIPVLLGRGFIDADTETAPKVALLNEAAARFYFGSNSPLGAQVQFAIGPTQQPRPSYEIVGVVKDARSKNLREPDTKSIYIPITQARDRLESLTLAVRCEGKPTALINAVTGELHGLDLNLLLYGIATVRDRMDQSLVQERLLATLSLFFCLLALLLAGIGLYGVMSYDVVRRTSEVGVRMALGAGRGAVLALVMRQGMTLTGIGVGLGLPAALGLPHVLTKLLFGVQPGDPLTVAGVSLLLLLVALLACWLPAHRAARVDPIVALHQE
jgi:predicted permease